MTFCFAGLQKLANPAFFRASNPASIQAQLLAASHRSPIHALIQPLVHLSVPLGVMIALAEVAVGLGTLAGLFSRVAAAGGALISLSLFLTVSFHTNPYYTGSDIVFVFAWLPLLLSEPGSWSADTLLAHLISRRTTGSPAAIASPDRRAVMIKAAAAAGLGGLGLIGAGLIAGLGRLLGGKSTAARTPSLAGGSGHGHSGPSTTTTATSGHPLGRRLGPASNVPVGGAASFQDPGTGDPALVVQPHPGTFLAFDAVCPHAGCTVQYAASSRMFVCPCHGSQFDGRTGDVVVGPAATGLKPIPVAEGSDGDLYGLFAMKLGAA